MIEAVKKYSGVDFNDWKTDEDAIAAAKEHHVELPEVPTKGAILAEFFDAFVEDKLIQPTFIYDYPVEISPLAKRKPDDPAFTERFEYFIDCTEYGNAFSELNDPIDQKGRFERQVAERKAIEPDCKAQVDYDYVNALEYGLPPTGGLGFGPSGQADDGGRTGLHGRRDETGAVSIDPGDSHKDVPLADLTRVGADLPSLTAHLVEQLFEFAIHGYLSESHRM